MTWNTDKAVPAFSVTYRPQNVAELDHQAAKSFFKDLLKSGEVAHAFLFAGPRGTGKTSGGRILAKLLNCEKNLHRQPGQIVSDACGHCSYCQEIAKGSFLDLIEIDAASNRGIDEIRSLREKIKLAPSQGRVKVYLIDEVHMLTTEAFNALLKTLEEPPAHAYFILATTQPDKLPETIRSRCVEVKFNRANQEEIVASLQRVIKHERLKVEPAALNLIAKAADGSFRDAHKWLERLSIQDKKITLQAAEALLSFGSIGSGRHFLKLLAKRQTKEALGWLTEFVEAGNDPKLLIQNLLELIHDQLMAVVGVTTAKTVEELASLEITELTDLASRLNRAGGEIKTAVLPQLPLELMVIEWGKSEVAVGPKEGAQQKAGRVEEEVVDVEEVSVEADDVLTADSLTVKSSLSGVVDKVQGRWGEILAKLKPHNGSITGLLRSCRVKGFDGRFLEIEAFYPFHHEKLQSEKVRQVIEGVIGEVLGTPMKVRCILGKKPTEIRQVEIANVMPLEDGSDDLAAFAERLFGVE